MPIWLIPLATSAESSVFYSRVGHYVHKIREIDNWIPKWARGIGHFKMDTFGHLSGIFLAKPVPNKVNQIVNDLFLKMTVPFTWNTD